jgi:tellurite resistance protein TerC
MSEAAFVAGFFLTILTFLWIDLKLFARGHEPSFREGLVWSIAWFLLSLAAALPILIFSGGEDAIEYTTVYLIERSLSLDNLFVFLLLFAYFAIPVRERARLLFIGIVLALILRAIAIVAGIELIERFHFVIYILGVTLLFLAYRLFKGIDEELQPENNVTIRFVRKVFPVTTEDHGRKLLVRERDGRLHSTSLLLCLVGIAFADITFAIDSIPAAFAITQDAFVIFMGNAFALLGLRALFVLVQSLSDRVRYLDETIAVVLAVVAVKLLAEDLYEFGPLASLAIVITILAAGITISIIADRREARAGATDRLE